MTVSELREMLQRLEESGYAKHPVRVYDVDGEEHEEVMGFYYADDQNEKSSVLLSTKYGCYGES